MSSLEDFEGGEYIKTDTDTPPSTDRARPPVTEEQANALIVRMRAQAQVSQENQARERRKQLHQDIGAVVLYCTYGRPELSEPTFERFRRNLPGFMSVIAGTNQLPSDGEPEQRYRALVRRADQANTDIRATSRPREAMATTSAQPKKVNRRSYRPRRR